MTKGQHVIIRKRQNDRNDETSKIPIGKMRKMNNNSQMKERQNDSNKKGQTKKIVKWCH